ncbi:MAG TPA: hypothetical protein VEO19_02430, partial [Terriglobia bacterium]|nr:hypothetical protein [Terriglobia bacterium]
RARRKEIAAATFDPSRSAAIDIDLGQPTDPCVRLRMLLSLLGVLREEVRRRVFKPRQRYLIETYYQGEIGWRPARFRHLLWLFVRRAECQQQDEEELHDFVSEYFEGGEAAVETHYQELLGLLDEEIAEVEEEFRHEVEAQEKRDAIERDACLAPVGKTWETLLRQEMALDRSIDRKIKILLSLWKQHPPSRRSLEWQTSKSEDTAIPVGAALVAAQGSDKGYVHGGPGETPVATSSCHVPYSIGAAQGDSPAQAVEEKSSERTGNVIENKRSTREAAETCQNVSSSARCNSSLSKLRSPQSAAASLSVLR